MRGRRGSITRPRRQGRALAREMELYFAEMQRGFGGIAGKSGFHRADLG